MRKVLAALVTTGCFAAAAILSAGAANAQVDAWNGGWHVGGDYYAPTDYSYGAAPIYNYGSAPVYDYAYGSAPGYGYGYGSAPLYDYAAAPSYDYGAAPAYNDVGATVPAPSYAFGSARGYGPAVVEAPMQAPGYAYGSVPAYGSAVGAPMQTVIVRTIYLPARSLARRDVVMRRPARPAVAENTSSRPPRDNAGSASGAAPVYQNAANYDRGASRAQPIYDTAAAPAAHLAASANGPAYRYVYQRDRILVMDPNTNTVIQTLRR